MSRMSTGRLSATNKLELTYLLHALVHVLFGVGLHVLRMWLDLWMVDLHTDGT